MLGEQLFHFPGRIGSMARDLASIRIHIEPAAARLATIEAQLDRTARDVAELHAAVVRVEDALADVLEEMPSSGDGPLARAREALAPGD